MIRLSIIVPFYNVEKYIEECIRSLYNQDIPQEEYEVICVDDCSPDNSCEIIERMAQQLANDRISRAKALNEPLALNDVCNLKLIRHERNKKLGGARNTGLREAKGEYVWYVDSDDTIYPNVLKTILDATERTKVDILQFDYIRGEGVWQNSEETVDVQQGETYLFSNKLLRWNDKLSGAWRQIFRREYLQKNELAFIEDAMYEDTDYLLRAFLLAEKVQYIPIVAYDYRINTESVTVAPMSPERLAWRVNLIARCRRCVDIATTQEAKDAINQMVTNTLTSLRKAIKVLPKRQRRMYAQKLEKPIKDCRKLVNWRTWLAIRYGITLFI